MRTTFLSIPLLLLAGCIAPDYGRLVPENKDADIEITSARYGHVRISTRVNPLGTNPLGPLVNVTNTVTTVRSATFER